MREHFRLLFYFCCPKCKNGFAVFEFGLIIVVNFSE